MADNTEGQLTGRGPELAELQDAVAHGRTLLLLGDPGTGKTRLLTTVTDQARERGHLVLTARGTEAEAHHSFASLHQLLLPLLTRTATLPDHQRTALDTALGTAPTGTPADPMLLRLAVLTLLTEAESTAWPQAEPDTDARTKSSRPRHLLLTADDLQLFDRDSLDVLAFVLRRTTIPTLLAARGQTPPDGIPTDLRTTLLGPLSDEAAADLLDAQPHAPTGRARSELLAQAQGNPLALIELSRAAAQGLLPTGALPQPDRIQRLYAARLPALPDTTRRLLLYAAASQYEDLVTVMEAAGTGDDLTAWAPAEDAGLVTVADGRVLFRHPLARAGCYHAAPAHQRQQAHRDLAAALTDDPSRRAWHLAAACPGRDESVAAALEDTARLAERCGGFHAAARALQRAAECSPAPADRARRYAKALHAATNAADPSWVRELYDQVTALTTDRDVLSMAACGVAMALSLHGRQRQATQVLTGALTPTPPTSGMTVFALASVLGAVAYQSGLPEPRDPLTTLLAGAGDRHGDTPYAELSSNGSWAAVRAATLAAADPTHAPDLLRDIRRGTPGREPADRVADLTWTLGIGGTAWYADESDLCVETFRQVYEGLSAYGAMGPAAPTLTAMAGALIDTGRWAEADEHLERIAALAAVHALKFVRTDVEALRATLRALRGVPGGTDLAWTAVDLDENRATHARLLRAEGAAATVAGDHEAAYRHFRGLFGEDGTPLHYFLSPRAVADLAAAAHRTGRQKETAPVVEAVRIALGPRPTTRTILLLHHAAALTGPARDAEHHFRLATVNPAADQWPLARAQARLHYAQWLRRRRRPLDARPLLAVALETFTRLGAAGLAEEARVELRASGVAATPVRSDPLAELTAQQREIVRLAAKGLRNREIAERLMVSPRTVSSHLYQVYPKLGVSSRNQLRDLVEEL
ncbi:AAA family ATPase [Streptomyces acidiscabies]|uniref:AAA family ATPase n=1 Tax=Streptomyces acidiscabies TaxID=42234 RepID=UPI000AAD4962|nr:LuxR family transcriptional regulator [Streptomyces acidiscabies]